MEKFTLPVNLQVYIESGYQVKDGDLVWDAGFQHNGKPKIMLTGNTRPKEESKEVFVEWHDSRFEPEHKQSHLARYFYIPVAVVRLDQIIDAVESAYQSQHDNDFSPMRKLISKLKKLNQSGQ